MYKTHIISEVKADKLNKYIELLEEKGWICIDVKISSTGIGNTLITQYIAIMRKEL